MLQVPPEVDSSQYGAIPAKSTLRHIIARGIKYLIAEPVLKSRQNRLLKTLGHSIPFQFDLTFVGYRFGQEAALHRFKAHMKGNAIGNVLVVGCSTGHESEVWLKRGPRSLTGIDLYRYGQQWSSASSTFSKRYGCPVEFHQASCESLPFPDASFDLIHSQAVMEHVRNVDLSVREMTRVLVPGGVMWHEFGPLYFAHGGDHCIGAFGPDNGYDHVLLDEQEYRHRIHDEAFFSKTSDPHASYWAREDQFSFLSAKEYLDIFSRHLSIESVFVGISTEGLRFRQNYPEKWERLLQAGLPEHDLLIQSLNVLVRKPC